MSNSKPIFYSTLISQTKKGKLSVLLNLLLIVNFLYLSFGNLSRIVSLFKASNSIPVTEFLIYFAGLIYAFLHKKQLFLITKNFFCIYVVLALSFLYGSILNGFELEPFLYCVRLILILFSATVIGGILFKKYKTNAVDLMKYILNIYIALLILSLLIYVAFPESLQFWQFLRSYGIEFNGDPHVRRLVSTYLDPNYYAVIACIPLIVSIYIYRATRNVQYLVIFFLFLVSIMLSGSRSGTATAIITLVGLSYKSTIGTLLQAKIKKNLLYLVLFFSLLAIIFRPLYISNFSTMLERALEIQTDGSALARLYSFYFGVSLFLKYPFFGVGYNYLSSYMKDISIVSSVDSSLLSTLINFGLFITLFFVLIFVWWAIATWKKLKLYTKNSDFALDFYSQYLLHILVIVIFASQFNNILYYQFWLFPIITIGTYFSYLANYRKKHLNSQLSSS